MLCARNIQPLPSQDPGSAPEWTGATELLDSDDEADGRRARLHLWFHSQDTVSLHYGASL